MIMLEIAALHLWAEGAKTILHEAGDTYVVVPTVFKILGGAVVGAAQLACFGVIIELVDQIRWNALQRSK